MDIRLTTKGIETSQELRLHVERRLYFALSRFSNRIRRVIVKLEDIKGPQSGKFKQCIIEVQMIPRGRVAIESLDTQLWTVVNRASGRVGRAVARVVEHQREFLSSSSDVNRTGNLRNGS